MSLSTRQGGRGTGALAMSAGSQGYDVGQYRRLVAWLRGQGGLTTAEDAVLATGIPGRTVRAILSDADGVEFVLRLGDGGIGIATCVEEAAHGTASLDSHARTLGERVSRRRSYTEANLPRVQGLLL